MAPLCPALVGRLRELPDGRLTLAFKQPWRDGTTHVVLSPHELIEKAIPCSSAHDAGVEGDDDGKSGAHQRRHSQHARVGGNQQALRSLGCLPGSILLAPPRARAGGSGRRRQDIDWTIDADTLVA